MDPKQILVSNLCEALKQLQRYLVLALVASLSLMLLQLSSTPQSDGQMIQLPGIVTTVDVRMAKLILGAAHFILGLLAIASIENGRNIALKINDLQLRDAALSYPSVVTDADPWVRRPASLAPALFFLITLAVWTYKHPGRDWSSVIMAFSFGVLPYVVLMARVEHFSKFSATSKADGIDNKPG
jgi:hypothetical protein